tara:strand:+ start:1463 stop:2191 length:729 start_codon:yes stop_codon:yes gene_type:complete
MHLAPDIALLQEVSEFSDEIKTRYNYKYEYATTETGKDQTFGTAILTTGEFLQDISLSSTQDWVNQELEFFSGNIVNALVAMNDGTTANVMSVYSPAWRVNRSRIAQHNIAQLAHPGNQDLWMTEILWAVLKEIVPQHSLQWIIGGDLNRMKGIPEIWRRMASIGLVECLSKHNKATSAQDVPTFKNARKNQNGTQIIWQLDHLFVDQTLATSLSSCYTGNQEDIFDNNISDHLPVIANFNI